MTDPSADLWAWAHEPTLEAPVTVDSSGVLAVLVAHNGDQWLPRTLVGLARLETRPGFVVAVDAESTDESRSLLGKGLADGLIDLVVDGRATEGFGENVARGMAASADSFTPSFLWFLHDDSAPEPDTLTQLLVGAATPDRQGRTPGIVVPKLLHPRRRNHPDQMSAVGETIAPSGARVLTIEPGDIDQHQVDAGPVLGASTAGLLVTSEVWQTLGGFDPHIPLFRDGVDLGWRANEQGIVVMTRPQATLRHVEAGRVGLRSQALTDDPRSFDAQMGMTVVARHSAAPRAVAARMRRRSWGQALGFLLGKSPSLARGRITAASRVAAIAATFDPHAPAHPVPAELLPGPDWEWRNGLDRLAGRVSDSYYDLVTEEDQGMIDELTGDEFAGGQQRSRFASPALVGMLVMLVASFVAARALITPGFLTGPGLLPAPVSLGDAWAAWTTSPTGQPGASAPWLALMALGSTLFIRPDWFVTVLVCGAPALAGWAAFRFLKPLSGAGWWTPLLAMTYAVWGPLMGSTTRGSVDLALMSILIPVLAGWITAWGMQRSVSAERWRNPAKVALGFAVLVSCMPWVWLLAALAGVIVGLRRRAWSESVVVIAGPLFAVLPWIPRLVHDPGRMFTGTDPLTQPASAVPSGLRVLTGSWLNGGAPQWLGALAVLSLLVAAGAGAVRNQRLDGWARWALLGAAGLAPVVAVAATRVVVPVAGTGVRLDPSGALMIWGFAMICLVAAGIGHRRDQDVDDSIDDLAHQARVNRSRSLLGVLTCVALVIGMGWWLTVGERGLHRQREVLPSYVVGVQASERNTRTLMVDLSRGVAQVNVAAAGQPTWGSAESPLIAESAAPVLDQVSQQFAQGQPTDDLAAQLTSLGIGHVWLRGASEQAIAELSTSPGMDVATVAEDTVVFTLSGQPARWMRTGDHLVLSEPVDEAWHARVDGVELTPVASEDWRMTWDASGTDGTPQFSADRDWAAMIWEIGVVLFLLILAAPSAQRSASPRRAMGGAR